MKPQRIFLLLALLLFLALASTSLATPPVPLGPWTVTMPLRPTPNIPSGQFRSHVTPVNARRVYVSISAVFRAKKSGTIEFVSSACETTYYSPCGTQQKHRLLNYHAGYNRVRWHFTFYASKPILTLSNDFSDISQGEASGFANHILQN